MVGVKPTYGRVSRYGLIAFASSLDQIGPLARDVRDAALLLGAIAGADRRGCHLRGRAGAGVRRGARPGRARAQARRARRVLHRGDGPGGRARGARRPSTSCATSGAIIERVSLPVTEYALATYYIVAPAEASSNLARYDGVKYGLRAPGGRDLVDMSGRTRAAGFGAEVKRRIMLGTYALSAGYYDAYYGQAQKVRTLVARDFAAGLRPGRPGRGAHHAQRGLQARREGEIPLAMYLNDVFTVPASMAGLPRALGAVRLQRGGLPIGLQLIGRPFDEARLLSVAHAYEQATPWHTRRPELA